MQRLILALLAALLLLPLASAHGAPSPKDQDTRLIADHNDDCGGDDANSLQNCQGSHDLIAIDVREVHDAQLGDAVTFRFFLNGGDAPAGLKVVFTLKAAGAGKTFELRTTNNQDFQGTGFDRVAKAASINDGTRFVVDATVKRDSLGPVGTKLSEFRAEAYRGSTRGDYMPGGYHGPLGDVQNPPQGDQPTNYLKPDYALRGPSYYLTLSGARTVQVPAGDAVTVELQVGNALRSTAQAVTATVDGAQGIDVGFQSGGATYLEYVRGGGSATARLDLHGASPGASGTLTVTFATDAGGRNEVAIPYTVALATAENTDTGDDSRDSPAAGALLIPALLALAILRRRLP